jgi:hypothetical protein
MNSTWTNFVIKFNNDIIFRPSFNICYFRITNCMIYFSWGICHVVIQLVSKPLHVIWRTVGRSLHKWASWHYPPTDVTSKLHVVLQNVCYIGFRQQDVCIKEYMLKDDNMFQPFGHHKLLYICTFSLHVRSLLWPIFKYVFILCLSIMSQISEVFCIWTMPSSGVWRRVDVVDWTDVSEDRIASIFRVEKNPRAKNQREQVAAELASSSLADFFLPWRWRRYDPPKRLFNRPHLHGATPQKTAFFIVTAVKTSNPTCFVFVLIATLKY